MKKTSNNEKLITEFNFPSPNLEFFRKTAAQR